MMADSKMSVDKNCDDLLNEILCLILEFVPTYQLLQIELVNKKWRECAKQIIGQRIIGKRIIDERITHLHAFGRDFYSGKNSYYFRRNLYRGLLCGGISRYISNFEDSTLHVPEDLVRRHSDVIFQISTKCPNIKTMNLFDQNMPDKFFLMSIANLFPKLEEIQFKTGSKTNETEQMSYHLN